MAQSRSADLAFRASSAQGFREDVVASSVKCKGRSRIPLRAHSGRMDLQTAHRWEELHRELLRVVHDPGTAPHFETLRSLAPSVRGFSSLDRLLGYLAQDLSADLDSKNDIYADLVRAAQERGTVARLAQTILWLGLWPGLSGAVRRRAWMWRDSAADVIGEVTAIFTRLVARMDLGRVHNVIATLVRSTERDLIASGPAGRKKSVLILVADVDELPSEFLVEPDSTAPTVEPEDLQVALAMAVRGREGDPVIQSLLLGLGAKHIVTTLGIKAPAARKRLERARKRLRATLAIGAPLRGTRAGSASSEWVHPGAAAGVATHLDGR